MEEIRLWKVFANGAGGRSAKPIVAAEQTSTEAWLEDLLVASPELLMVGLQIVGRQSDTEGGPLDLLGVDEQGRLVVFELKRGALTRLAVAQAVDYASFLSELSDEELGQFISANSGKYGVAKIPDFAVWYGERFPSTGGIGKPRVVLVGVGADKAAKRMVKFLNESGVDISIISFHAYVEGGETLLARQVEARGLNNTIAGKNSKAGNQAELDRLLDLLQMKYGFEQLSTAFKEAFGTPSCQWPYRNSYAFSRPGSGTYMTLYADAGFPHCPRVYLQPRAVKAAGLATVQTVAEAMGATLTQTPYGYVYFRIDTRKAGQAAEMSRLAEAIASGGSAKPDGDDGNDAMAGAG